MKIRIEDGDTVIEYDDVKAFGIVVKEKNMHSIMETRGRMLDLCMIIAGLQNLAERAIKKNNIKITVIWKLRRILKKDREAECFESSES